MIKLHIVIVAEVRKIGNTVGLHSHRQCWLVSTNRCESQIVLYIISFQMKIQPQVSWFSKMQVCVLKIEGS